MISCYRRITHFVSANKRTIFCDTFKLSPLDDADIKKLVDKCKTRKTKKNHEYQILRLRENIRVLGISNPDVGDKESVGCAILVDVGSDHDPDDCLGLAHLLEHVICRAVSRKEATDFYCVTRRFNTLYSFPAKTKNYGEVIQTWAKTLFDTVDLSNHDDDMLEVIRCERERVDNEFNEQRDDILDRTLMVLKSSEGDMNLPKFRWGNRETMEPKLNELGNREAMEPKLHGLLTELNKLRERYRQSTILICTYSQHQLKMETIAKSLNFEDFLCPPQRKAVKRPRKNDDEEEQTTQRNSDISKYFFVAKSDDDRQQLRLIFPITHKLNLQQSNTIKWIRQMIECTNENYLMHRLRTSGMATNCFAIHHMIIVAELTEKGLKNVESVSDDIKRYIKHLHDYLVLSKELTKQTNKNGLHDFDKLPSNMKKASKIVTHFDEKHRTFDEMKLFRGLSGVDGAKIISKHLLENKNIVHMISARNPEQVLQSLAKKNCGSLPNESLETESCTEPIYRTKFFAVKNTVFNNDFKATNYNLDTKTCQPTYDDILYRTPIDEPKDVAFRRLFAKHLDFHISGYKLFVKKGFMVEKLEEVRYYARNDKERENMDMNVWPQNKEFKKGTFSLAKEQLLFDLATEMRSSSSFAESLMDTALNNIVRNGKKIDPVPLQYETLLDMTHEDYFKYTKKITSEVNPPDAIKREAFFPTKFVQDFSCYSIHTNESVTATFIFYQISKHELFLRYFFSDECQKMKIELDLYTGSYMDYSSLVDGILIKFLSVESKQGQDIQAINAACNSLVTRVKKSIEEDAELNEKMKDVLTRTVDIMEKKKIKIQVIGYKKPQINEEKTFEEQFKNWLRHNKTSCEKLRNGI